MAISGGCPSYKKHPESKNDTLKAGCWAENGTSYIYVEEVTEKKVHYMMFDIVKAVRLRESMKKQNFVKVFSYENSGVVWTWHDKTDFPLSKVYDQLSEQIRKNEIAVQLTASEIVAQRLSKELQAMEASIFEKFQSHTNTLIRKFQKWMK